jgi:peptidoglycan/LPS O-acetylase OafA/YrhL
MRSRQFAWDPRRVRRWIATVVCLGSLATVALVIPRFAPRSPVAIVLLCALAVLTMKLVEHRVRRWFDRWAARQGPRTRSPKGRL